MHNSMWPFPRARHAVVFLDYMNAYLTQDQFYQGSTDPRRLLLNCYRVAHRFLADTAQVMAFLNLAKHEEINFVQWARFTLVAREMNVRVVDVPSFYGIDQVDSVMFEALRFAHERLPLSVPFALVTLDKHFIPVTEELKADGRPMLNLLPLANRFSAIGRAGHTYQYLDDNNWLYLALFYAFGANACLEAVPASALARPPAFQEALKGAIALLERLRGRPRLKASSLRELAEHVNRISRTPTALNLIGSPRFIAGALLYYRVLVEDEGGDSVTYGYLLQENHPALLRLNQAVLP